MRITEDDMKPKVVKESNPVKAKKPKRDDARHQYEAEVIAKAEYFTAVMKLSASKYWRNTADKLDQIKGIAQEMIDVMEREHPHDHGHAMVYAVAGTQEVFVGSCIRGRGWVERRA